MGGWQLAASAMSWHNFTVIIIIIVIILVIIIITIIFITCSLVVTWWQWLFVIAITVRLYEPMVFIQRV